MALAAGATFAGCRVIEQLGAGGMGEVFSSNTRISDVVKH